MIRICFCLIKQHPSLGLKSRHHSHHCILTATFHTFKLVTNHILHNVQRWRFISVHPSLYPKKTPSPAPFDILKTILYLLPFGSSFLLLFPINLHFLHFAMTIGYHWVAVGDRLGSLVCRFASVCVVVEVSKEDDEGHCVANQSPLHPVWEWASCVEWVSCMANGDVKLDHLNNGKVFLPPEVLLHVRT